MRRGIHVRVVERGSRRLARSGWLGRTALDQIERHPRAVVVLHDVADAALPRLDEFLHRVGARRPAWSQDFPDECTPIRNGLPTASFDTLDASD